MHPQSQLVNRNTWIKVERYEIIFIEIGNDEDHVHFLVQSVPTITVTKVVTTIKSTTAREIFKEFPRLRKE